MVRQISQNHDNSQTSLFSIREHTFENRRQRKIGVAKTCLNKKGCGINVKTGTRLNSAGLIYHFEALRLR